MEIKSNKNIYQNIETLYILSTQFSSCIEIMRRLTNVISLNHGQRN